MIPTTRTLPTIKRLGWTQMALVVLTLTGTGCAHHRHFHGHTEPAPAFGTETSAVDPLAKTAAPVPDPYVEGLRQARDARENRPRSRVPSPTIEVPPVDLQLPEVEAPKIEVPKVSIGDPPAIPNTLEEPRIRLQEPEPTPRRGVKFTQARQVAPSAPPTAPTLASLIAESRKSVDRLSTYQVAMRYQERVGGTLQPLDAAVLSIHR
ncbi:MAG: hypothetical protein AB7I30_21545, partial [Isosphaeraceae bacterium]